MGTIDRDNGRKPIVYALIWANGAKNITIEGKGTIDANGGKPVKRDPRGSVRPRAVFLKSSQNVVIRGVTIQNSALYTTHLALCDKVLIEHVRVLSPKLHTQENDFQHRGP